MDYTVSPVEVKYDAPRSPQWPEVRKTHLEKEPSCRACGGTSNLEVHHIKPFHIFPNLELVDSNLVTLCMEQGHNCHFVFGHLLDYQAYNLDVQTDVFRYLGEVKNRKTS